MTLLPVVGSDCSTCSTTTTGGGACGFVTSDVGSVACFGFAKSVVLPASFHGPATSLAS